MSYLPSRLCLLLVWILGASSALILQPPFITLQPHHEQLYRAAQSHDELDEPFKLDCEAVGNPEPTYHWEKNGLPFNYNKYETRISQQLQSGTLIFTKPDDVDEGIYQCFAKNALGTAVTNLASVRKSELGSFPEEDLKDMYVTEGVPLSIHCNPPGGYPKPNIFWMIQSQTGALRNIISPRIVVDPEGDLHFSNVTLDDALEDAIYACSATSFSRREYKLGNKIRLHVEPSEGQNTHPVIKQYLSPPNVLALKGEKLDLSCIFGGTPQPVVVWKKNGKDLHYLNDGKTLHFSPVHYEDEATYECTASNGVGPPVSHTMAVTVQSAPSWLNKPDNSHEAEGENLTFPCNAEGIPEPAVQWYKNGILIENDPQNSRKRTNGVVLYIDKVNSSDTAVYQCNASNVHGYLFWNFYLNVLALPPTVTERLPPVTSATVSSSVTLTCRVFGSPKPKVKWTKDGKELLGGRYNVLDKGDLEIVDLLVTDEGNYTCHASNLYGDDETTGKLQVREVPDPPRIVDVTCDHLKALVEWQPMGDNREPILSYTLRFNTSFTPENWEDAFVDIPASDTKFTVSLSPWANYTFQVIARNKIGLSDPSGTSDVCTTSEDVPHKNPENVTGKGTRPDNLVISWTPMPMIEQNAPGFFYKVFWNQVTPSSPTDQTESRIITDWTKSQLEIENQETFQMYLIKVEAHNSRGQANIVPLAIIAFSGEGKPEQAPRNFRLLSVNDSKSATFAWDPVPPESVKGHFKGYKIQTWTGGSEKNIREHIVGPNITQAIVSILKPSSRNIVRVLAFNGMYNGIPSKTLQISTPDGASGPVASFQAVPIGTNAFYLTWKKPLEPNGILTGYRIFYREVIGTELSPPKERFPPISSYRRTRARLSGLKPDTKYRLDIHATTRAGIREGYFIEEKTNEELDIDTDEQDTACPHLLQENKTNVRVSWRSATVHPGGNFIVRYRRKGVHHWDRTSVNKNQGTVELRNLEAGTLYEMQVVPVKGHHKGPSL